MYAAGHGPSASTPAFRPPPRANAFYRANLAGGPEGLSVAFDLATHRGYDSDHPRVTGDVGKAGVAIDSVEDMKILFDGIPLDKMSRVDDHERRGAAGAGRLHRRRRGAGRRRTSKLVGHHPERHPQRVHGPEHLYLSARPSMRIVADIIEHTAEHMPKFNSISISGYHMQEAGATLAQELAFTLADGMRIRARRQGQGPRHRRLRAALSFFFGIGMNFFMEVAKLRAARFLWAAHHEAVRRQDRRIAVLRTHCQTSGVVADRAGSVQQRGPHHLEAMAAVLGGTQSLHTNSFDEAIALPTPSSRPASPATRS
jgi:methylmalonyl-CoA mutase